MRALSVALIIVGVVMIGFGAVDHYLQFIKIPYELYIFGVVGFIVGAVGGILSTQTGGVTPTPPEATEGELPLIIEK